jgi:hypothetical protein
VSTEATSATRLELARHRDKLLQITVGPSPTKGVFMRPNRHGQWGNDIHKASPTTTDSGSKTPAQTPGPPTPPNTANPKPQSNEQAPPQSREPV